MNAKKKIIICRPKHFLGPQNYIPSFCPAFSGAIPSNTTTPVHRYSAKEVLDFTLIEKSEDVQTRFVYNNGRPNAFLRETTHLQDIC